MGRKFWEGVETTGLVMLTAGAVLGIGAGAGAGFAGEHQKALGFSDEDVQFRANIAVGLFIIAILGLVIEKFGKRMAANQLYKELPFGAVFLFHRCT